MVALGELPAPNEEARSHAASQALTWLEPAVPGASRRKGIESPVDVEVYAPEIGHRFLLQQAQVHSYFPGSLTWVGRAGPDSLDEMVVTVTHDAVAGRLTVGLTTWLLEGSPQEVFLRRADVSELTDHAPDFERASAEEAELWEPAVAMGAAEALASSGGPYASGGVPVVDLLVVYGQGTIDQAGETEGELRARIINAVAEVQNGLNTSAVTNAVRLVGMEKIGWAFAYPDPAPNAGGTLAVGATLTELIEETSAPSLREAYGADVVVGITKNLYKACGNSRGDHPPVAHQTDAGYIIVGQAVGCLTEDRRSMGHELGHQAGLNHWREELVDTDGDKIPDTPACQVAPAPQHRYGFNWPMATEPIPPGTPICASNAWYSWMAGGPTVDQTVNGVTVLRNKYVRVHRYANPNQT